MTQTALILAHLNRGGTLTALQALRLYDCLRLAARVERLRGQGHDIQTQMVKLPSGKHIAQYYL